MANKSFLIAACILLALLCMLSSAPVASAEAGVKLEDSEPNGQNQPHVDAPGDDDHDFEHNDDSNSTSVCANDDDGNMRWRRTKLVVSDFWHWAAFRSVGTRKSHGKHEKDVLSGLISFANFPWALLGSFEGEREWNSEEIEIEACTCLPFASFRSLQSGCDT